MKIVQDRDDGEAEIGHQRQESAAGARIEMVRRFVEEEDARLLGQRPGDLRPLSLAARERAHFAVGEGKQFHAAEGVLDDGGFLGARPARGMRYAAERHVVAHGNAMVGPVRLSYDRNAPGSLDGRHHGQRLAEEADRAGGRSQRAGQNAHERGLARAVRADDGKALAGRDVDRNAVEKTVAGGRLIAKVLSAKNGAAHRKGPPG